MWKAVNLLGAEREARGNVRNWGLMEGRLSGRRTGGGISGGIYVR